MLWESKILISYRWELVTDNYSTFLGSCLRRLQRSVFCLICRRISRYLDKHTEKHTIINRSCRVQVFRTEMKGKFVIHKLGMFESFAVRTLFLFSLSLSLSLSLFFLLWTFLKQKQRPMGSNRTIFNSILPENLCWVENAPCDIHQLEYFSFNLHLSFSWVKGVGDPDDRLRTSQREHGKSVIGSAHAILFRTSFAALFWRF